MLLEWAKGSFFRLDVKPSNNLGFLFYLTTGFRALFSFIFLSDSLLLALLLGPVATYWTT